MPSFDESAHARGGDPANRGRFSSKDEARPSAGQLDDASGGWVPRNAPRFEDFTPAEERAISDYEDMMREVWDGPNP